MRINTRKIAYFVGAVFFVLTLFYFKHSMENSAPSVLTNNDQLQILNTNIEQFQKLLSDSGIQSLKSNIEKQETLLDQLNNLYEQQAKIIQGFPLNAFISNLNSMVRYLLLGLIILTIGLVGLATYQILYHRNEQTKLWQDFKTNPLYLYLSQYDNQMQVFTDYNSRFESLLSKIKQRIGLEELYNGEIEDYMKSWRVPEKRHFSKLIENKVIMSDIRDFFDLCYEEYALYTNNIISEKLWKIWKLKMRLHIAKPLFNISWLIIKEDTDYSSEFNMLIDDMINK